MLEDIVTQDVVDLVALLRRRRTDLRTVEVKSAAGGLPRSLRETLSAFSNTDGGTVLLGLAEETGFGPAEGFDAVKVRNDLDAMCADALDPPVRADIDIVDLDGGPVVVALVPALDRQSTPCFVKTKGRYNGSYTRGGDGDRQLTEYEVTLLVSERSQPMHDFEVVQDATEEDLDPDAVARLLRRVRARDPQPFAGLDDVTALRRLNVLKETGAGLRPTLAGLLTLGLWPQQFFPQLCVTFVAVPGAAKDSLQEGLPRFTDNATLRGPLPKIVEDAVGVILRNSRTAGHVQGVGRLDVGSYPVEALREAVTNAVAHRDYSPGSRGTQVQVELYVDRLVIRNPGGLFGTVLLHDLGGEGVSSSRNGLLVDLLGDVYLPGTDRVVVDNRGSGIPGMLARLRQAGMSLPTFESSPSRFQVGFPAHALLTQEALAWIDALRQPGLAHPQIMALALMKEGRPVSNATLRQLGLDSRAATSTLADLRRRGLVAKVGGRRYAEYVLDDQLPGADPEPGLFAGLAEGTLAPNGARASRPAPSRKAHGDREQEILALFGPGTTLTAKEVSASTGLGQAMTIRHLGRLVHDGRLTATAPPRSRGRAYRRSTGSNPARDDALGAGDPAGRAGQ